MGDRRRAICRECDGHRRDVGELSWTGLCTVCAEKLLTENVMGIHTKSGVPWARVKLGMARSLFGPDAARALFDAGYCTPTLDGTEQSP